MKRLVLAMAVLALGASVAFAGTNDGVVLTVHGDQTGAPTNGNPCALIPPGTQCVDTVPNGAPGDGGAEWFIVLAARNGGCNIATVVFGVGDYNSGDCYIGYYGACSPELDPGEIASSGWPGPLTGTAVSWAPGCLTGDLVPLYYFGVYAYGAGVVPLGDFFPGQAAVVVDCSAPPQEDPIAGFGTFGCGGAQGEQVCPGTGPVEGACCMPDGTCYITTEQACNDAGDLWVGGPCEADTCPLPVGACCIDTNGDGNSETCVDGLTREQCENEPGGIYQGDGTVCTPDTCPEDQPVATQSSTWGQIKSIYR